MGLITESLEQARDIANDYLDNSDDLSYIQEISFKISKYNLEQAIRLIRYIKSASKKTK